MRLANGALYQSWGWCKSCSRFVVWMMPHPGTRASRPHISPARLGRLRRWDGTATGPCPSFGLAIAVHADRVAACRQRRADAPSPPARNKVAGGTPAFPGGADAISRGEIHGQPGADPVRARRACRCPVRAWPGPADLPGRPGTPGEWPGKPIPGSRERCRRSGR